MADVSEKTQGEIEAIAGDIERQIAEKDAEVEATKQLLAEEQAKNATSKEEAEAATIAALKSRLRTF